MEAGVLEDIPPEEGWEIPVRRGQPGDPNGAWDQCLNAILMHKAVLCPTRIKG